jgi:hypothetical protein
MRKSAYNFSFGNQWCGLTEKWMLTRDFSLENTLRKAIDYGGKKVSCHSMKNESKAYRKAFQLIFIWNFVILLLPSQKISNLKDPILHPFKQKSRRKLNILFGLLKNPIFHFKFNEKILLRIRNTLQAAISKSFF